MKTTLNLDDGLMQRARSEASARGTTLTAVVEDALRRALTQPPTPRQRFTLRFPTVSGGGAVVDPADRAALSDVLDGRAARPPT
jgi:hypothetical protein